MQADGTVRIPLIAKDGSIRGYTVVDAADADFVNQWTWRLETNGRWTPYAGRNERPGGRKGKLLRIKLHRALLGLEHGNPMQVDHRDGDGLNNRRVNLRTVTHIENMQNRRDQRDGPHGRTSRHHGVSWSTSKQKWIVQVTVNGARFYCGGFTDEQQAARVAKAVRACLLAHIGP